MSEELSEERKQRKLEAAVAYHERELAHANDAVVRAQHKVDRAREELAAAEASVSAALAEVDAAEARVSDAQAAVGTPVVDESNVAVVHAGAENASIVVENGE